MSLSTEESQLRSRVIARMGERIFEPKPWRVLWFLVAIALFFLGARLESSSDSWLLKIASSLLVANGLVILTAFGHEVLHEVVFLWKPLCRILCLVCFSPTFLSPEFFRRVHYMHHDFEDLYLGEETAYPSSRFFDKGLERRIEQLLSPPITGVGRLIRWSLVRPLYAIFIQLKLPGKSRLFRKLSPSRVRVELALILGIYATLIAFLSWSQLFWLLLLPLIAHNLILSSYLLTQHAKSLLGASGGFAANACSVIVAWPLDVLHLRMSHHLEHHLFPEVNPCFYPKMREVLLESSSDRLCVLDWGNAIRQIFVAQRASNTQK